MIQRVSNYIGFLKKVNILQFYKLNYFSKNICRTDKSKIIPYKNTVVDISPKARIYLGNGDIEIGCDLLKGAKAETRVRLLDDAIWSSDGGCKISYGATIEVLKGAVLDNGYFTLNSNSTIVSAKRVSFGQDVMISRNVVIYDSDFHTIFDYMGNVINQSKPVIIGNHVWVGANCMILKGTEIESGSIIAAGSKASGKIESEMIYYSGIEKAVRCLNGTWDRSFPEC